MLSPPKSPSSRSPSPRNVRHSKRRLSSLGGMSKDVQTIGATVEWDEEDKKRLQGFLSEMLRVGCLKGFKYFALYLRGREELIVRVLNEPMSPEIWNYYAAEYSAKRRESAFSFTYDKETALPRNELSGYGFMDIGLPPASPSERDMDFKDDKSTLFLIAAYARYSCPYVWVRSNHERLVSFAGDASEEQQKDSPLKLRSTAVWKQKDTKLWDIMAEIVKLCMYPSPLNPFVVDLKYFDGLPLAERVIATGAMASFLQKVVCSGEHAYNARVFDDLGEITRRHFKALHTLLQQRRQQETQHYAETSMHQSQQDSRTAAAKQFSMHYATYSQSPAQHR